MDDYRVLMLAPTRRDREATAELLERAGIASIPCDGAQSAAAQLETTVGAVLLTDSAFTDPQVPLLLRALARQPAWSDVPVILLSASGTAPPALDRLSASLRNVTWLERPTSSRTLVSSIQAALRARARQYQLRDQLDALRLSEAALSKADRRKDLFLATLAHELRNPLAPIRTAAQVLADRRLAPSQLQWAQSVIQRQVAHMALLLDDLLDIARITQGKLVLKRSRVTLTEVIDSAVEAARPVDTLTLNADALRLSQVLSNLLTNAAKYTDPAGHIRLEASVDAGLLRVSVADDGIGIAADALSRIFEMFSQVDGESNRSDGGLGIGLSLVKGLIELHGGEIEARSAGPGRGSEFIVRLPLDAAISVAPRSSELDAPAPRRGARRIMIADDNKDAADALGMLLDLAGHDIRVVYNGRSALMLAQTFRPDVAFIDIGMPDLTGYEVAQQLRREPWGSGPFLVALTGWGQDDDRRQAREAGFDRHMTKPVDSEELDGLIAAASCEP
jgi:two-component system, sensor histidine kinase